MPKIKRKFKTKTAKIKTKKSKNRVEVISTVMERLHKPFMVFVIAIFILSTIFSLTALKLKTKAADNWTPLSYVSANPFLSKIRLVPGYNLNGVYNAGFGKYQIDPIRLTLNGVTYADMFDTGAGNFVPLAFGIYDNGGNKEESGGVFVVDPNLSPYLYAFLTNIKIYTDNFKSTLLGSFKSVIFAQDRGSYEDTLNYILGAVPNDQLEVDSAVAGTRVFQIPDPATSDLIPITSADGEGGNTAVGTYVVSRLGYSDGTNDYRGAIFAGPPVSSFDGQDFFNVNNSMLNPIKSDGAEITDINIGNYTVSGSDNISGVVSDITNGANTYHILFVTDDASSLSSVISGYGFQNIRDIGVLFSANGEGADFTYAFTPPVTTHTITASAGANGSITPSGSVVVNNGDSQSFNINPNSNYQVADVLVDSVSAGAVTIYNFNNVTADHTISASFVAIPSSSVPPTYSPQPQPVSNPVEEPKIYTQDQYDALKSQLDSANQKITDLQNQLQQLQSKVNQNPPQPISQPTTSNQYIVQPHDYLYLIATKVYGTSDAWQKLVDLNKDRYPSLATNPSAIEVGWILYY